MVSLRICIISHQFQITNVSISVNISPSQLVKSGQVFPKAGVCRSKTVALQNARSRCGDHEELLDGGGHVAGGPEVEEPNVPALAATLLPRPVLPWVRLVAGRLDINIVKSFPFS